MKAAYGELRAAGGDFLLNGLGGSGVDGYLSISGYNDGDCDCE